MAVVIYQVFQDARTGSSISSLLVRSFSFVFIRTALEERVVTPMVAGDRVSFDGCESLLGLLLLWARRDQLVPDSSSLLNPWHTLSLPQPSCPRLARDHTPFQAMAAVRTCTPPLKAINALVLTGTQRFRAPPSNTPNVNYQLLNLNQQLAEKVAGLQTTVVIFYFGPDLPQELKGICQDGICRPEYFLGKIRNVRPEVISSRDANKRRSRNVIFSGTFTDSMKPRDIPLALAQQVRQLLVHCLATSS